MMNNLLVILFLLVLTACQVSSDKPAGEIVTNHTNQTNSFSVTLPSSGWKKLGDNVDVTLTFPVNVTVTGTPSIPIVVGATNKNLTYVSGSGSKNLLFRYTVTSTDLDTDGIEPATNVSLNGGTITYDFNGIKNANTTLTIPSRVIKVDGIVPVLVSQNSPPDGLYITGAPLIYSLIFSEPVYTAGFPYFDLIMSSGTVPASYASGSGSFNLNFLRMVRSTDIDQDGISTSGSINLSAGTIKDEAGNSISATIPVINSPGVIVNKTGPQITSITPPASATYLENQNIDFIVNFDEAVAVTGTPRIVLNLTTGTVYANYLSGSGSTTLTFRHTVLAGEQDNDGVVLSSPLDLNAGTIKAVSNGFNAILTFTSPNTSAVQIDAHDPQVISVNSPSNGTYTNGQTFSFVLAFNEPVNVTGNPRVPFVLGGITKYLTYASGSGTSALTFSYVVQTGDLDNDGVALNGSIDLNSGSIKDLVSRDAILSFTAPSTPGVLVDAAPPQILLMSAPADKTYKSGEILDFDTTFNKTVNVTGNPRIVLTIGAVTKYATYLSGSGTSILKFRYIVNSGDNDSDGITLTSPLDINGGTIKNGTNDALLTYTLPNTTNVLVDTTVPILNSVTPPTNGTYGPGQDLTFTANFSKAVIVTGAPRIQLDIGGVSTFATYSSGSGSQNIVFKYNIQSGDSDLDGITHSSPIQLNSGTIRDILANDASSLAFTPSSTAGVLIDNVSPTIISVTPPANGTYSQNQAMNFTVNFSETVTITGTPRIQMALGASTVYLTYVSGSGSANAVFRYTPVLNEVDSDGVMLVSPLELDGGTIKDDGSNNCNLSFTLPNTSAVLVNGLAPSITSVISPVFKTYAPGETLNFIVNFNKNILATGSPRIALTIGSSTVHANYVSGTGTSSLTFRYTAQVGDLDTNGVVLTSPLDLNSGSLTDSGLNNSALAFTLPDTSGVLVDGVAPTITSITPPANATYRDGDQLNFTVNWSENVSVTGNPRFIVTIGASNVYATYVSGSGSSALLFRYTVESNDQDLNGISIISPLELNLGTIKDLVTNDAILSFTAPDTSGVIVDVVQPAILSVVGPANGTYEENQNLDFTVTFNKPVDVTGAPRLNLTIGATTRYASYVSGSGSATHLYRYTVQLTDYDENGITTASPLDLNGGTIRDNFNNNSSLTFASPNLSSVNVDALFPVIVSVIAPINGTYEIGQNLDFTVNFNKPVFQTGTPRIPLTLNSGSKFLTYVSGGGTSSHIYRYTVVTNDNDPDGVTITSPIDLNTGTLKDARSRDSDLIFTAPNTTAVLIDGILPVITSVAAPASKTYIIGENIDFTVTMNKAIIVTGTPNISLTVGGDNLTASYVSGSGTTSHIYRYTVLQPHVDTDGITVSNPINLSGGSLKDMINQNLDLNFTPPSTTAILVDGIRPTITSVSAPANKTYIIGESLDFVVNWSENVTVTGFPRISLTVGATTLYATYLSGTGTTSLTFRYTVSTGEADTNGIVVSSPLDLNTGNIHDVPGNAVSVITFTPPVTASILVDGILPTLVSVTAPGDATYKEGQNLTFTANFSENMTVNTTGGTPSINLNINGVTRSATYVSGTGTSALLFRYNLAGSATDTGEEDLNGIGNSSPILLNSGTIRDIAGNSPAALTFTPPITTGVLVDVKNPTITSITTPSNFTSIKSGSIVSVTVNFSEPVTIATANPTIAFTINATARSLSCAQVTNATSTNCTYTIPAGNAVADLDLNGFSSVGSLTLGSSTIRDAASHNANVSHSAIDLSKVYAVFTNIKMWVDFDQSELISTATCGANQCVTGVTDKSSNGNHITSGTSPGPVLQGTGFGTGAAVIGYAQYDNASSLNLPNIPNVKYQMLVAQAPTTVGANAAKTAIGGSSVLLRFSSNGFSTASHTFTVSTTLKQNTAASGAGTTVNRTWAANGQYVYQIVPGTVANGTVVNYSSHTLGTATFNGQIVALLVFDNSAALTTTQLDALTTQLNALYTAF